ncbi:hypothetical protein J2785_002165 [Burkholderia ambifaria]|nr:MEKHLA domain-containing protein [Burkholderia ambifaria]MDR6499020.1 hypothetical protein [Burkholderia ambifaria]
MNGTLAFDREFHQLLTGSYSRLVGASLLDELPTGADSIGWLYERAPFCVLAHSAEPDPTFVYANLAAQHCFEYDWVEFTKLRSRLSAEYPARGDRGRMLDAVRQSGWATGYRGIRVSKNGRRFWIRNATVWNLIDDDGGYRGQAAMFRE